MALYLSAKDSPNSQQCRQLLGDLTQIKEKRKGRMLYIYMSLFIAMPIAFFAAGFGFGNRSMTRLLGDTLSVSLGLLSVLLSLFFVIWFISRELQLVEQTIAEPLFKEIVPLLNTGEKPLLVVSGMIASTRMPPWLSSGHPGAFFIFTSDRLLMITLNTLFITGPKLLNHLTNGTFGQVVDTIYTVDLLDKDSITFGGINKKRFMFSFSHTQITLTPMGETDSLTIILANNLTRSGRLLKIIRDRLENGYSNNF